MDTKIISLERLYEVTKSAKAEGKVIVSTSGCFDILHAGHVDYLEKAKEYGDILVVFLNSDESVRKLKGPERPIVNEDNRAIVLAGLGCVDYVSIFSDTDPCNQIQTIKPQLWVKGADYQGKTIPEKKVIDSYGGQIQYVRLKEGCSSTGIIEKIKHDLEMRK